MKMAAPRQPITSVSDRSYVSMKEPDAMWTCRREQQQHLPEGQEGQVWQQQQPQAGDEAWRLPLLLVEVLQAALAVAEEVWQHSMLWRLHMACSCADCLHGQLQAVRVLWSALPAAIERVLCCMARGASIYSSELLARDHPSCACWPRLSQLSDAQCAGFSGSAAPDITAATGGRGGRGRFGGDSHSAGRGDAFGGRAGRGGRDGGRGGRGASGVPQGAKDVPMLDRGAGSAVVLMSSCISSGWEGAALR